jgi:hypothetical protein
MDVNILSLLKQVYIIILIEKKFQFWNLRKMLILAIASKHSCRRLLNTNINGVGTRNGNLISSFNTQLPNRSKIFSNNLSKIKILNNKQRWFGSFSHSNATNGKINPMKSKEMIKKLLRFVWPKDNSKIKMRVVLSLSLLVGAKLLNLAVPFLFKEIVDFLNKNSSIKDFGEKTSDKLLLSVFALIIAYGAARVGTSLFGELRSAIFATVAQSSVTKLATNVFSHLHKLDLSFHLNRQTGALSKVTFKSFIIKLEIVSTCIFNR